MADKYSLMQELRIARRDKDDVLNSPYTTPVQRAQAHADFFTVIRAAASDPRPYALSRQEIAEAANISRQRLYQIIAPPKPTEVQLPETDV